EARRPQERHVGAPGSDLEQARRGETQHREAWVVESGSVDHRRKPVARGARGQPYARDADLALRNCARGAWSRRARDDARTFDVAQALEPRARLND
ncbi:MAG TPA: hypothetical protein VIF62_23355, partial [Labilithrix sp.]